MESAHYLTCGLNLNVYAKRVGNFILEIPLWVVACTVAGCALFVLKSSFTAPFLVIAASAVITRLTLKVVKHYKPKPLKLIREKISSLINKNSYLNFVGVLPFVIILISPVAAVILGVGVGVYKGAEIEVDVIKHRQNVLRNTKDGYSPDSTELLSII